MSNPVSNTERVLEIQNIVRKFNPTRVLLHEADFKSVLDRIPFHHNNYKECEFSNVVYVNVDYKVPAGTLDLTGSEPIMKEEVDDKTH